MLLSLLIAFAHATETEEAAAEAFTFWGAITHSGWFALTVLIVLTFMGIVTVIVAVERLIAFLRARGQSVRLVGAVAKHFQNNDIEAALAASKKPDFKVAYLGTLLRAGLSEMAARQDDFGVANAERALNKATGVEIAKLRRGMSILATVGSTAPFVGLAGTVVGVMNSFSGMSEKGAGSLSAISGGIAEALITTAVGIVVAIIGVWCFNFFNQWIDKIGDELSGSVADFLVWANKLVQPDITADGGRGQHASRGK